MLLPNIYFKTITESFQTRYCMTFYLKGHQKYKWFFCLFVCGKGFFGTGVPLNQEFLLMTPIFRGIQPSHEYGIFILFFEFQQLFQLMLVMSILLSHSVPLFSLVATCLLAYVVKAYVKRAITPMAQGFLCMAT